jgi:hypothetical protein
MIEGKASRETQEKDPSPAKPGCGNGTLIGTAGGTHKEGLKKTKSPGKLPGLTLFTCSVITSL